jgi:hypothetical protein
MILLASDLLAPDNGRTHGGYTTRLNRIVRLAVVTCWLAGQCSLAGSSAKCPRTTSHDSPELTILVFNHASVPESDVCEMQAEVRSSLSLAGIQADVVSCSNPGTNSSTCRRISEATALLLQILPKRATQAAALGEALPDGAKGKYAYVYWSKIENLASEGRGRRRVLDAVATHEVGHLLLGTLEHSGIGLMSKDWNADDLARLTTGSTAFAFSSDDCRKMRANVKERWRARVQAGEASIANARTGQM